MIHQIGTIFEVTPFDDLAGNINLDQLRIHQYGEPTWIDYGVMSPSSKGRKFFALPTKQPIFPVKEIETSVSLYNGETAVFGGIADGTAKNADVFTLVFVTPRRLTVSGLHSRRP